MSEFEFNRGYDAFFVGITTEEDAKELSSSSDWMEGWRVARWEEDSDDALNKEVPQMTIYQQLVRKINDGESFAVCQTHPYDEPSWFVFDPTEGASSYWLEEGGYNAYVCESLAQLQEFYRYSEWAMNLAPVSLEEYNKQRIADAVEFVLDRLGARIEALGSKNVDDEIPF